MRIATLLVLICCALSLSAQVVLKERYHPNGRLAERWLESSPGSVKVFRFFDCGQLAEMGSWYESKPDGPWANWSPQGQKLGEAWYENGRKVGIWRFYDLSGQPVVELRYSRGKLVEKRPVGYASR
jgi:antitoxin component YwqK of YwqJK toxin-antitoxin module